MGPASPLRNVVDGLKWALCYSLLTLLMASNGPSTALEKCRRWPQIGPTWLIGSAAGGFEWAQHPPEKCCRWPKMGPVLSFVIVPTVPNGPSTHSRNAVDGLKWARFYSLATLPMVLNGPGVALEKCCQRYQMGPVLLLGDSADGLEWAPAPS